MVEARIRIRAEPLAVLCRRHHIRRLALFGSVLREDFGPDSDVDVLVEFDPDYVVGFRIFRVEEELSRLLGGRRVDLVDPQYLNRYVKGRILSTAQVQFEDNDAAR